MANLNINLLPPELEVQKKARNRQLWLATISTGFLIGVVALAAIVLALRLSQVLILGQVQKDVKSAKTQVSSPELTQKQAVLLTLKSRLANLDNLLNQQTLSSYVFKLISSMLPSDVQLTTITISANGTVNLTVQTTSVSSLETFFNNLVDPSLNQKKIVSVSISSLNRFAANKYSADLIIYLAGGSAK